MIRRGGGAYDDADMLLTFSDVTGGRVTRLTKTAPQRIQGRIPMVTGEET